MKERSAWVQVKVLEGKEEADGKAEGGTEVEVVEEENSGRTSDDRENRRKRT